MNAAAAESAPHLWSEEPSKLPVRRRIRARIGGLLCSLCTGTIEKALNSLPGVEKVAVSLTHEQALIEYDPNVTRAEDLLQTLMDVGYVARRVSVDWVNARWRGNEPPGARIRRIAHPRGGQLVLVAAFFGSARIFSSCARCRWGVSISRSPVR